MAFMLFIFFTGCTQTRVFVNGLEVTSIQHQSGNQKIIVKLPDKTVITSVTANKSIATNLIDKTKDILRSISGVFSKPTKDIK